MTYENLLVDRDGQIAVVTLNRLEKLNAIDHGLHLEMMQACKELREDDAVRVVIWTGEGRGFCSRGPTSPRTGPKSPQAARNALTSTVGWADRR